MGSRKDRIKEMSADEAKDLRVFDRLLPRLFFAVFAADLRSRSTTKCRQPAQRVYGRTHHSPHPPLINELGNGGGRKDRIKEMSADEAGGSAGHRRPRARLPRMGRRRRHRPSRVHHSHRPTPVVRAWIDHLDTRFRDPATMDYEARQTQPRAGDRANL